MREIVVPLDGSEIAEQAIRSREPSQERRMPGFVSCVR